eukprot:1159369-Pelagomonas_calceolata.AAC.8
MASHRERPKRQKHLKCPKYDKEAASVYSNAAFSIAGAKDRDTTALPQSLKRQPHEARRSAVLGKSIRRRCRHS